MKQLPIYDIVMADDEEGVKVISLVKSPAVKHNFMRFSEDKTMRFAVENEEQRIVTGLIGIAETPIYRNNPPHGEHYVVFSRDVILRMVQKYARDKNTDAVNLAHSQDVDGVYMFESYIKDTARGISPKEFEDVPDGSWFGSYKVDNAEVWQAIRDGKFNGFSLQGYLSYAEPEIDDIETLINHLKTKTL